MEGPIFAIKAQWVVGVVCPNFVRKQKVNPTRSKKNKPPSCAE